MFTTVLVADDGSAPAGTAVRTAQTLARLTGAELLREPLAEPAALHRAARDAGADLLVAPATARPEALVHGSPCAVTLVPVGAGAPNFARIGVAFDGSASSRAAVVVARDLASAPHSPVRELDLALVEPAALRYHLEMEDPGLFVREPSAASIWIDHAAAEPAGRARVRAVRREGDPVTELAQLAERWDLLLMGSRSRGPLRSLLLGSISGRVARRVTCPVLIVPRIPQSHAGHDDLSRFGARVAEAMRRHRADTRV